MSGKQTQAYVISAPNLNLSELPMNFMYNIIEFSELSLPQQFNVIVDTIGKKCPP